MIEIRNLSKAYRISDRKVQALKDISISINDGEIYGIIGMSGAGKSTLVRCINMIENPTSGSVIINGTDMTTLNEKQLRKERQKIAMIFQGCNLLMQRSCQKNVCFPLELAGMKKKDAEKRALELLELVGISDKSKAFPVQLSGGQKQRVAIARALATNPQVLLCDEATSALDPKTTHSILQLIRDINKKLGITVVIITHQMSVVEEICDKVAILDNGEVVEEGKVSNIFATPKTQAAKRLVYPEDCSQSFSQHTDLRMIRVIFNGAKATNTPIIAEMAIKKGIIARIIYASTKSIGKKAYGNMILGFDDNEMIVKEALLYLSSLENITVQEVK